jgi:hypothetical protein
MHMPGAETVCPRVNHEAGARPTTVAATLTKPSNLLARTYRNWDLLLSGPEGRGKLALEPSPYVRS